MVLIFLLFMGFVNFQFCIYQISGVFHNYKQNMLFPPAVRGCFLPVRLVHFTLHDLLLLPAVRGYFNCHLSAGTLYVSHRGLRQQNLFTVCYCCLRFEAILIATFQPAYCMTLIVASGSNRERNKFCLALLLVARKRILSPARMSGSRA